LKHLDELNVTYGEHFQTAIINAVGLAVSSMVLFIHALVPFLFTHTASTFVNRIMRSFPRAGNRILVRFNTKWEQDPAERQWRILVNGVESLAHRVNIQIPCQTIMEPVEGCEKYHFLCYGKVEWDGTYANIVH